MAAAGPAGAHYMNAPNITIYDLVGDGLATSGTDTATLTVGSGTQTMAWGTISSVGATGTLAGGGSTLSVGSAVNATLSTTFTYSAIATGSTSAIVYATDTDGTGRNANIYTSPAITITGVGVAPTANNSVTNSNTLGGGTAGTGNVGFVLVGQSTAATVTVNNSGNGNLSNMGVSSNLNGSVSAAGNSVFSGAGGLFSLKDNTTSAFAYTFKPTGTGTVTTTAPISFSNGETSANKSGAASTSLSGTGVAPVNAVTGPAGTTYVRTGSSGTATVTVANVGNGNLSGQGAVSNLQGTLASLPGTGFTANVGNPASANLGDGAATTLGFVYAPGTNRGVSTATVTASFSNGSTAGTNAAQTVTAVVTAQGVGATYQSQVGTTVNTPTAVANGATVTTGPTLNFGTLGKITSATVNLFVRNVSVDPNGGNANLTNLTIEKFIIAGPDGANFTTTLAPGTVIGEGGSVMIPITFVAGNTTGLLSGTLTLFTDENSTLGGIGDTFTYQLAAMVPEPGGIVLLVSALGGLLGLRRSRRQEGQTRQAPAGPAG